jgi:integrase
MPKPAQGELRWTDRGPVARVTISGKRRESFPLTSCRTREEATERMQLLAELAQRFRKAGVTETPDARKLLETAAGCSPHLLAGVRQVAGELVGGELVDLSAPDVPTFEDFGKEWTGGKLAKRFPDQVREIIQDMNELRLEKSIYPLIGAKRLDAITRADCDLVMRNLPTPKVKDGKPRELSRTTRRQYAGIMNRILNLAELAGYIERNPLPRGWLPKAAPRKRFPILYATEDQTLLACTKVWIGLRLFYGFLHREGMRRSEATALQVMDVDLEHETIALDENKTNHPRWWKLSPGTARALKRWFEVREAKPTDLVFIDENGGPLEVDHMADRVRAHLVAAKLDRADLTSTGPLKGAFGTHCFRRSFVTRSLALGRNEDWVRQRTGHTSDELLGYRQAAKSLAELELGDLSPLDRALGDLFGPVVFAPGLPQEWSGRQDSNLRPLDPQSSALTRLRYAPIRPRPRGPGHRRGGS